MILYTRRRWSSNHSWKPRESAILGALTSHMGNSMPLSGTNSVVPGSRESLPDLGCGRNRVVRTARSSAESGALGGEHDAGSKMD